MDHTLAELSLPTLDSVLSWAETFLGKMGQRLTVLLLPFFV